MTATLPTKRVQPPTLFVACSSAMLPPGRHHLGSKWHSYAGTPQWLQSVTAACHAVSSGAHIW